MSSIVLLLIFQGWPVLPADLTTWILLVLISVCGSVAQTTMNKGAQMIDASKSAVLRNADIGFVLLWQILLFQELPTLWGWIGLTLICACTIMVAITKSSGKTAVQNKEDTESTEPEETEIELEEIDANSDK